MALASHTPQSPMFRKATDYKKVFSLNKIFTSASKIINKTPKRDNISLTVDVFL